MIEIILVGINAQYMHTSLAVRQLAAVVAKDGNFNCKVAEYTINQHFDDVFQDLALQNAKAYFFSCYIWNIELVKKLAKNLFKVCENAVFVAGGPQVAYSPDVFLKENPAFKAVCTAQGENAVVCIALAALGKKNWKNCPNTVYRNSSGNLIETFQLDLVKIDDLPFAYQDLHNLNGRIAYYESTRGCPYNCSYCLSGKGMGVYSKNIEKVFEDLEKFIIAKVPLLKFVDRTFNVDKRRALDIWQFLVAKDNGITCFHFEIVGNLLNEESMKFLKTVRSGLFQFEIGVQSTNLKTLQDINRGVGLEETLKNAKILAEYGNIHLHLDLIAGLPKENLASFAKSFNTVQAQNPQQIQLGFLKVLPGSQIIEKAKEYGLVWQDEPPFEILCNNWLGFEELCQLKNMARMVDIYYNSGKFNYLIGDMLLMWDSAFCFYSQLAGFYKKSGAHLSPLSKLGQYQLLANFAKTNGKILCEHHQWLCRMDMALQEKPNTSPQWVHVDGSRAYREQVLEFYRNKANIAKYLPSYADKEPKQILKNAHIEVFPFNPKTGKFGQCAFLFNYQQRDISGKAMCVQVNLPL